MTEDSLSAELAENVELVMVKVTCTFSAKTPPTYAWFLVNAQLSISRSRGL